MKVYVIYYEEPDGETFIQKVYKDEKEANRFIKNKEFYFIETVEGEGF